MKQLVECWWRGRPGWCRAISNQRLCQFDLTAGSTSVQHNREKRLPACLGVGGAADALDSFFSRKPASSGAGVSSNIPSKYTASPHMKRTSLI